MIWFVLLLVGVTGICVLRHPTALDHTREAMFRRHTIEANEFVEKHSSRFEAAPVIWWLLEPYYDCELKTRLGNAVDDGAKYICNQHHLARLPSCLYYGFGVANEISFDLEISKTLDCEMFVFDPTPSVATSGIVHRLSEAEIFYHSWGIGKTDDQIQLEGQMVPAYRLATIMQMLGHTGRVIDILKIDVEGAEWDVLEDLLAECDPEQPVAYQLLVELHGPTLARILPLRRHLERCGYRMFSKDTNFHCLNCLETSYVHVNFLKCMNVRWP